MRYLSFEFLRSICYIEGKQKNIINERKKKNLRFDSFIGELSARRKNETP